MSTEIETLYDAETIRGEVAALGRQLQTELVKEDPVILSLLGGSVVFLADLIRAIEAPVRFEFIHVQYSKGKSAGSVLEIEYPIPLDVVGQSLLILKDVVSSGVIETYLGSQLRGHGARGVRFAALLDLPDERKTPFDTDYRVFAPHRQGTFVGYGLKHDGRYGNLPYIGWMEEPHTEA